MGNNNSIANSSYESTGPQTISKSSFQIVSIIGKGSYGKVWKVKYENNNSIYAMKEMSKVKIIDKKCELNIISERNILSKMKHPFIINMNYSFQDKDNLYLILDYLSGGDLRYNIIKKKKFNEKQTKFFLACIILGLEYCNSNMIIHGDLKPENLLLDEKGYIKITDFGSAKIQNLNDEKKKNKKNKIIGTLGYMAPEVVLGENPTKLIDYFSLGIIGYELMKGNGPFIGKNQIEIRQKTVFKQISIKKNEIPDGWSYYYADFINKLLQKKLENRLGFNGIQEIKNHPWFLNFNWRNLYFEKIISPYIPEDYNNNDNSNSKLIEDSIDISTLERYKNIMNRSDYNFIFYEYYYFDKDYREKNGYKMFMNPHEKYSTLKKNDNDNVQSRNKRGLSIQSKTLSLKCKDLPFYYHNSYNITTIKLTKNKSHSKYKGV